MKIIIDSFSEAPIYIQIADQIERSILTGETKSGEPLPSIRALANDLGVSVITTKRVYETLEAKGLIITAPQRGSFVNDISSDELSVMIRREIASRSRALISYAAAFGINSSECTEIFIREVSNDAEA